MLLLKQVFRFVRFYLRAQTRYNVHSPFVFQFTEAVLEDDRWFYAFSDWERLREFLRSDQALVEITDFGAGSLVSNSKKRSLASLAKYSAASPEACRMLFRLVNFCKPEKMLELGTSLAISTGYQAAAARNAEFVTVEGCASVARYALKNLELAQASNVRLKIGRFEELLGPILRDLGRVDYVLFDGNHRLQPTLDYFETCLAFAHENSVFVFDDIHWSADMEHAWATIKQHPRVTLTIDLYQFGVVFFRKEQLVREHFTLVPWAWKPWKIGFWDLFRR